MSEKGFGLVEVLITALIGGLVVAGVSSQLLQAFKFSKNIEAKVEFNSLVQSLELVLKDPSLCSSSMFNSRKLPDSIVAKFDPDKKLEAEDLLSQIRLQDTVIAALGRTYSSFTISQMHLTEVDKSNRQILSPIENKYLAMLHLEGEKSGSNKNGALKHDFLLWVTTKSSNIESCMMSARSIAGVPNKLPKRVVFEKSETFIVPPGVTEFRVTVVGGGGGGAGVVSHSSTELGGGGGGGGEVKNMVDVSILSGVTNIPITVGKGGRGGVPPTDGEDSSFGAYVKARGGKAPERVLWGGTYQYTVGGMAGGNGGTAGNTGFAAASVYNLHKPGGMGGATLLGTGGPNIPPYVNPASIGPTGYGGGGGGGDSRNKGGGGTVDGLGDDGANGVVIVEYVPTF